MDWKGFLMVLIIFLILSLTWRVSYQVGLEMTAIVRGLDL